MIQRYINQIRVARNSYPGQFWLIVVGLLISTIGTSMVFPFLTIYVSERLDLPLTEAASLIAINGAVALFASLVAGPITDRGGRKWIMVFSLAGTGLTYFMFSQASTYLAFALLMAFRGLFQPLYRVGTNAMVTDLIPAEQRADAFALVRMSNNVGIALGPAIGGFVVATSYTIGFTVAAVTLTTYAILIALYARETVPQKSTNLRMEGQAVTVKASGYSQVIKDRQMMAFLFSFTLFKICSVMLWTLSAVYAKQNYLVSESQFGLIPMTNALMVVLFQVGVTKITKRYLPLPVMAIGTLIYALGVGSMVLGGGFWGFWLSFVVLTVGELMLMPTSSAYVANLAPVEMRGRYMSSFSLSQGAARTIAPLLGGLLNDNLGPKSIWYGGGLIGLTGAACFAAMAKHYSPRKAKEKPALP